MAQEASRSVYQLSSRCLAASEAFLRPKTSGLSRDSTPDSTCLYAYYAHSQTLIHGIGYTLDLGLFLKIFSGR